MVMNVRRVISALKQRAASALAVFLFLLAAPAALAADADSMLIGTFNRPLYIASAPGQPHLLFVVEECGQVQVLENEVKLGHAFLDISRLVTCSGERGLLSIAFPPDYDASSRFYVAFTNLNGDVELDEFIRQAG